MRSTWSITNEQNALQRKLKSPADIQRLKKTLDLGKIVRTAICVADSYRKMKNVMHHARLKNILEKLIVVNSPTCLDFKNPSLAGGMGVGVETLQYLAFAPKKHWDNYLVLRGFPFLDLKSEFFQAWAESSHSGVAMLAYRCTRIDGISHFFENCDHKKAEFRGG